MSFNIHEDEGYGHITTDKAWVVAWSTGIMENTEGVWESAYWFPPVNLGQSKEIRFQGGSEEEALRLAREGAISNLKEINFEFYIWCQSNEI